MTRRDPPSRPNPRRYDRILKEEIHDTYRQRRKVAGTGRCSECGALFSEGRWSWADDPYPDAEELLCPACARIRDDCPAGELHVRGAFAETHGEEIRSLLTNLAKSQGQEHPLKRIISISGEGGGMTVNTTDVHLPHQMGHALHDAYKGELDVHYDEEGYFARVEWRRDK